MTVLCDFCSKTAVGYLQQQMFIYCEDHEEKALDLCDSIMEDFESPPPATLTLISGGKL